MRRANGNIPSAGTAYAFVTGPVQVRVSDPTLVGDDINGTLNTSNNDVTFRAERFVLAEWDTALAGRGACRLDMRCPVPGDRVMRQREAQFVWVTSLGGVTRKTADMSV